MSDLRIPRRAFLKAASSVGITAGVAGCSRDEPKATTNIAQPSMGEGIQVDVFADFFSPASQSFYLNTVKQLESEYVAVDQPAIELRHFDFVLPADRFSRPAANGGWFVQQNTGASYFWQYMDTVFRTQNDLTRNNLVIAASDYGQQPTDEARTAIEASEYERKIRENIRTGEERGVTSLPAVFVAGKQIGSPSFERVAEAIEQTQ